MRKQQLKLKTLLTCPVLLYLEILRVFLEVDRYKTCQDLASAKTLPKDVREIGKTFKFGKWFPHQLGKKTEPIGRILQLRY